MFEHDAVTHDAVVLRGGHAKKSIAGGGAGGGVRRSKTSGDGERIGGGIDLVTAGGSARGSSDWRGFLRTIGFEGFATGPGFIFILSALADANGR